MFYYRSKKANISFSQYEVLDKTIRKEKENDLSYKKYFIVKILGYCLMPTHFHILIKQIGEGKKGIQFYLGNVVNSFTRYYNIRNTRKGPLFLPRFQSRAVFTDELLLHISRYIHLNPYTSGVVKKISGLKNYSWSSFKYFVDEITSPLVDPDLLLAQFKNSKKRYLEFVLNQADYQKSLGELSYLRKW
jgi:putative transposase